MCRFGMGIVFGVAGFLFSLTLDFWEGRETSLRDACTLAGVLAFLIIVFELIVEFGILGEGP